MAFWGPMGLAKCVEGVTGLRRGQGRATRSQGAELSMKAQGNKVIRCRTVNKGARQQGHKVQNCQ